MQNKAELIKPEFDFWVYQLIKRLILDSSFGGSSTAEIT